MDKGKEQDLTLYVYVWWAGVKSGRFPKPVKLGSRITVWRIKDIRDFIEKASL
ncbi:TPA: AlpA family phage regulatory protein [Legionella pneumophila]|uniref:helix-turn-helix transcriptional regulator n=1 Tax=Legionella pneumophila TaxID=446 RepID=UPI0009B43738|nr:AlpA family phage regulatory protein [Legionella pneumophila]HAT8639961.1 AlpA family phage regulatory protein [Legionella pneumophila]